MTRDYILWHLREAAETLPRLIQEMETDREYSETELMFEMMHLYHHINTAWNAREASAARVEVCCAEDFRRWRQFPTDIDMTVGVDQ